MDDQSSLDFASIFMEMDGPSTSNATALPIPVSEAPVDELEYLDLVHTDSSCSATTIASRESVMELMTDNPDSMAVQDDPCSSTIHNNSATAREQNRFGVHQSSESFGTKDGSLWYATENVEAADWNKFYYKVVDPHADLIEQTIRDLANSRERQRNVDRLLEEELLTVSQAEHILQEKEMAKKDLESFLSESRKREMVACFVCSKAFFDEDKMRLHIQENHISRDEKHFFKCPHCSQRFKHRQHMNRHINHQHKFNGFTCKKCHARYSTPVSLNVHLSRDHGLNTDYEPLKTTLKCTNCGDKFGSDVEIKRHLSYCTRRFEIAEKRAEEKEKLKTLQSMTDVGSPIMLAAVCSPSGRPKLDKSCPICGLVTASMQKRNNHIKAKHPEATDEHLKKTYVKIESPNLPYGCIECGKRFASHASLSVHKKRLHEDKNDFECQTCHKRYPLQSELRKHIRRVHEKIEEDNDATPTKRAKMDNIYEDPFEF